MHGIDLMLWGVIAIFGAASIALAIQIVVEVRRARRDLRRERD